MYKNSILVVKVGYEVSGWSMKDMKLVVVRDMCDKKFVLAPLSGETLQTRNISMTKTL